jgi:mono/diheme cytochrome c family protein
MSHKIWGVVLAALALALPVSASYADDLTDRGAYLAKIMDCGGCHTPGAMAGDPQHELYLSGSDIGFMLPGLGIFYPPNLTSDAATGLGTWSTDDIIKVVREGTRPDGSPVAPIMPWPSYGALTDEDALALATYLKSLPAIEHQVPAIVPPEGTAVAPYLAPVFP